ncbi:SrfA family protein [Brenneria populi subsp. brevivirga]|uniref:SrfA family protein n=1 Tax=Brenneria populi TaxID=1505588 RepID=UPI002E176A78|nr:SrfA family protein [Brenneria populi subsp. brevivirga]
MTKLFLRSGSLDDFLALGENGQPVYASALQLRETLRLRKQQQIADCLAIPQPNERGDRIDWYSPIAGKVTSWIAASEQERLAALKLLETYQSAVADISRRAQHAEKPGQKLFGVLLAKAIQFPGPNHVYLVDGQPVLTFWGFVNLDKKSRDDALDCLRSVEKTAPPLYSPVSAYEAPPAESATQPEPEVKPAGKPEPLPAPEAAPSPRARWLRFWWGLPVVALLAVLALQIRGWIASGDNTSEPPELAAAVKPEKRALPASVTEPKPEAQTAIEAAPVAPPKPAEENKTADAVSPAVAPAETAAAPVEAPSPANDEPQAAEAAPVEPAVAQETPAEPPAAARKGELLMPADAVRMGSVKFLNGSWRVSIDIKTPVTGRPPSLIYQIKEGKGTAKITHGDGVTCRANIEAGLMSSGNLVINSRYQARCSDNTRYRMPEIVCKQGTADIAECTGRYNADAVFPMTIKRESKR